MMISVHLVFVFLIETPDWVKFIRSRQWAERFGKIFLYQFEWELGPAQL